MISCNLVEMYELTLSKLIDQLVCTLVRPRYILTSKNSFFGL